MSLSQEYEELTALMGELLDKAARYDWLCRNHGPGLSRLLALPRINPDQREINTRIDLYRNLAGVQPDGSNAH